MYSNAPRCSCGHLALASHSNTYCSRECALSDAELALVGSQSHYRQAQTDKRLASQRRRQRQKLQQLDISNDSFVEIEISDPIPHSGPAEGSPPIFVHDDLSSASTLSNPVSSPHSARSSPSSKFPAFRKLFKVGGQWAN